MMIYIQTYKKLGLALSTALILTACGVSGGAPGEPSGLDRIVEYAQYKGEAPSIQDYKDAGVIGVDSEEKLAEINQIVEGLVSEDVDTTKEVQTLVNRTMPVLAHNGSNYGVVTSPYTGKVWLDRNLGAKQVCTTPTDTACYGDYYQWGRNFDGHEKNTSKVIIVISDDVSDVSHGDFIKEYLDNSGDWGYNDDNAIKRMENWSKIDGTFVCPLGFRVPSIDELAKETTDSNVTNSATAFSNFLKLPLSGRREESTGVMKEVGLRGLLWSNSKNGTFARFVDFNQSKANRGYQNRAYGVALRCLKD